MIIEFVSLTYRMLLPFPLWLNYYRGDNDSEVFMGAYTGVKITLMWAHLRRFMRVVQSYISNTNEVGEPLSAAESAEAGRPDCPICLTEVRVGVASAWNGAWGFGGVGPLSDVVRVCV